MYNTHLYGDYVKALKQLEPTYGLLAALAVTILALVLALSLKQLKGRNWLVAWAVITLINWTGINFLNLLIHSLMETKSYTELRDFTQWYQALGALSPVGTGCLGVFLWVNWQRSRQPLTGAEILTSFEGRTTRANFWIYYWLSFAVSSFTISKPFTTEVRGAAFVFICAVTALVAFAGIWSNVAVAAKRWHDFGKSGWMTLVIFIPIVGPIYYLVHMGFLRGHDGTNLFGEDPRALVVPSETAPALATAGQSPTTL